MTVNLVNLRDSDLPFLTDMLNRKGIRENLFCDDRLIRQEQISELLYATELGTQVCAFGIMAAEELVGCIVMNNVHSRNRSGNITHLAVLRWNYALKASRLLVEYGFNDLNLNRVECRAYGDNRVTPLLCKKIGLKMEGIVREVTYRNGQYADIKVWSILRSEWKNGNQSVSG